MNYYGKIHKILAKTYYLEFSYVIAFR